MAAVVRDAYQSARSRSEKTQWSNLVVKILRQTNGQFRRRVSNEHTGSEEIWVTISDQEARKKVGHCIRDVPDTIGDALSKEAYDVFLGLPQELVPEKLREKAKTMSERRGPNFGLTRMF